MVCIGLDLGSTHGCVGVWQNGRANIIANDQGFRTTPCYVSFEGDEVVVGDTAVNKLHTNSHNTIYHLKRALGQTLDQVQGKDFVKNWGFVLEQGEGEQVVAATQPKEGDRKTLTPQQFCAIILKNLKQLAEDFTSSSVESCVLTLPAHYGDAEKQVLQEAAKEAELKVSSFLSEPLAAAIAYGLDDPDSEGPPQYALVFDVGGASHDVSVVSSDKGLLNIVASKGSDTLGGEDFTDALLQHCIRTFKRRTKIDIAENKRAINRLKLASEQAKKSLSTQNQVTIEVDSLAEGEDFLLKISRPRYEELIAEYVAKTISEIDAVLEEADLDNEAIEHVILVGGTCRTPLVQQEVAKFFGGKDTLSNISPDEAFALGATLEASWEAETLDWEVNRDEAASVSVVPLTLSVCAADKSVTEIIPRNAILPAHGSETFTTSEDNQTSVYIQVYEGERVLAKDNTLLANVCLEGITAADKGVATIEVTFDVTKQGELNINAVEKTSGQSKSLTVTNDPARLDDAAVAEIVQKAEEAADEDLETLEQLEDAFEAAEIAESAPAVSEAPAGLDTEMD